MGSIDTKGDFFVITVKPTEEVVRQQQGLMECHIDIMNYIFESAKQMADFLQTDINETGILRTPRRTPRRTSERKRKLSSAASGQTTSKKGPTSSFKVRDVTSATPRRFSKRSKRSTMKLDTTIDQIKSNELPESVATITTTTTITNTTVVDNRVSHHTIQEDINGNNSVEVMDIVVESRKTEEKIEIKKDFNVNDVLVVDNKVMTASELMSELSIKEDDNQVLEEDKEEIKANESENEWMTDDEECQKGKGSQEFYDAVDARDLRAKAVKKSANNSLVNKTLTSSSTKDKRKKSLYFTPQTTQRSTRAQTRMLSRIADSSEKTPQTTSRVSRMKDSNVMSSAESNSSRVTGTSSNRSVRSYSRIQKKVADSKSLTDSAMKRRQESEEQRKIKLMASQEKEKRAVEKRRILLEERVNERKIKSQEKANKAAELRERQKQMETERLKKELERRDEYERRQNQDRMEQLRKKQEEMVKKAQEVERRKQMKEMQEMETKMRKEEERKRKEEQERERQREQEKMAAIIQQHNISLQQKAVANSFIKKQESNTQLMPKVVVNKLSPKETEQHLNKTYNKESEKKAPEEVVNKGEANRTYVKENSKELSSYDMTPPPKEYDYDNYDISEIQSDDDTDDEQQPRKRIPGWARGQQFIQQVHNQYNKSHRAVNRDVKGVFGTGESLLERFQIEFDLMFPKQPLHPRYAKRTSSAVWEEEPSRYRLDESEINQSFNH